MRFWRSRKHLVGLDVGTHSVKACRLHMGGKGFALDDFGMVRLPPDLDFSDRMENREELARGIQAVLDNLRMRPKEVATSISGFSVIIKQLSLPYPNKRDLMANIEWEAEQHIPFGVQDVTMDVNVVGPNKEKPEYTDAILVAAKNEHVQAVVDLLAMVQLSPGVIDVDLFALENAYEANYPFEEGSIALIDIGANQLKINVLRNGVSVFTREASLGGNMINTRIRNQFGVTAADAERIKLSRQAPPGRDEELRSIFEEVLVNWSREIKRALDYVTSGTKDVEIGKILLAGGCALTPGFTQFLQRQVGAEVELFDPFLNIAADPKKMDPDYLRSIGPVAAVSVGLALRKVGDA